MNSIDPQRGMRSGSKHIILAVAMGILPYVAFPLLMFWLRGHAGFTEHTGFSLYPLVSLGAGLVVGYRLRHWGWAYGTCPLILLSTVIIIAAPPVAKSVTLGYNVPVGLVGSMLGGFIGERLEHPSRVDPGPMLRRPNGTE